MIKLVIFSLLVLGCEVLSHPAHIIANVKRGGCTDVWSDCSGWISTFTCDNNMIKLNCKVSCGACNECMDKAGTSTCLNYKSFCNAAGNVGEMCQKTCGLCGGAGGGNPNPQPQPQPRPKATPAPPKHAVLIQGTAQACADAHNEYRRKHHAPDLTVDYTVLRTSEAFAKHLANSGTFDHDTSTPYGENLWKSSTSVENDDPVSLCKQAVKKWYDEIKDYDYNRPVFSMATGHFTQVVWKNSQRLGMAIAKIKNGRFYTYVGVARYDPSGNYRGQFSSNVLRE